MTLKGISNIAGAQTEELKNTSIPVINQQVSADVEMSRLRRDRGERIGDEVAQIEAAKSRLAEAQYELMSSIYESLLGMAGQVEVAVDSLAALVRLIQLLKETIDVPIAFLLEGRAAAAKEVADAATAGAKAELALGNIFTSNKDRENDDDVIKAFFAEPLESGRLPGVHANTRDWFSEVTD
ncbi:MAG: hypothetical protein AAFP69_01930 [Planctomycetota bacterium]